MSSILHPTDFALASSRYYKEWAAASLGPASKNGLVVHCYHAMWDIVFYILEGHKLISNVSYCHVLPS